MLYKINSGADLAGFATDPGRYQPVFDSPTVVIYATNRVPCGQ